MIKLEETDMYEKPIVVVRVSTGYYVSKRGLHCQKNVTYQKRKSKGFNFFEEDLCCIGAEDVAPLIKNINEVSDGLYFLNTINEQTDWETGYVDSYDYMLVPYMDNEEN